MKRPHAPVQEWHHEDLHTYLRPLPPHAPFILGSSFHAIATKATDCFVFLDSGTLLGLVRNKALIAHDTDIDINIVVFDPKPLVLPPDPKAKMVRTLTCGDLPMQHAYLVDGVIVDTYFFYVFEDAPDVAININDVGTIEMPARYYTSSSSACGFPVPGIVQDYLVWRFGPTWNIPDGYKRPWTDAPHLNKP
jgi:hypothetical protein